MAEGYKSVFNTSEEIYDFYCSPCLEEKRNNEAEKFCTSCKLYYCKSCLKDHNKFPALKFHQIKDVSSITAGNVPQVDSRATSLTVPCEHHPDEIVKMYCGKHDVVCCTICIALDHRECKAVDYIPKLAKDIGKSTAYTDFMKDMRKVKLEYERTKQAIEEEIQNMTDVKQDIIKDIKRYKLEVIAKLEELERKSVDRVNERFKLITEKMNAIATKVAECLGKVTTHLQESETKSEAEKFVRMKKMKERKMAAMDISLQNVEALSFSLDRRFQSVLDETDTLVKVDKPVEVTLKRKYNISFKNDTSTCSVSDICILNDDTVVLADIDSLKRLDRSFLKLEKLDITGQPFGICRTSHNEFAVTLRVSQKVQFVSYTDKVMTLTNAFHAGAPCKGICLVDGIFFISCGGGDEDDVSGHIRKFDMSGKLLCTIDTDRSGEKMLTSPRHIHFNVDKNKVFVADRDNGLIVLDKTGQRLSRNRHITLNGAFTVISSKYGLFLTGLDSHNIVQYGEKGRCIWTVLNEENALALYVDDLKGQMILSMDHSDKIFLFNIST